VAIRDEGARRLLDGVPLPMVLLASDRRVLMQNAAAEALPNLFACFGMSYGRLTRFVAAATEPFEHVFARALNGSPTSAVVTLQSKGRQGLWRIGMGPVGRGDAPVDAAVVMLIDPPPAPGGTLEALRRLFGLSAAEARVLALLLDDCRPREIADELNLSITTVRSHLKALFAKTYTRRQSELVALAWSAA
jgi:DNA-binding CsgD family transcriptional regulator